jgi:acyl-CoA reductase-like NAD-dependent aldehyde dehydrogenase
MKAPMTETLDVRSPFDSTLLATLPVSTGAEVESAFATAHALFRDRRRWLPKIERAAILRRAAAITRPRRDSLALQVAQESGKPLRDALIEIDRGIDGMELCVETLRNEAGHVVPMDLNATSEARVAFTQMEPIGVVLGLAAFNHPFNLVVHQLAPAVAVGAPVIVKPSPKTPLSCRSLIEIFHEAGLPAGFAQMVLPLDFGVIGGMVADPRVGFLSFIGSAAVGWKLRQMLAPGARCGLEHGGVAPVIVAADAAHLLCPPHPRPDGGGTLGRRQPHGDRRSHPARNGSGPTHHPCGGGPCRCMGRGFGRQRRRGRQAPLALDLCQHRAGLAPRPCRCLAPRGVRARRLPLSL